MIEVANALIVNACFMEVVLLHHCFKAKHRVTNQIHRRFVVRIDERSGVQGFRLLTKHAAGILGNLICLKHTPECIDDCFVRGLDLGRILLES